MMTYEQYQQAIVDNQEAMKEARQQQLEERKRIERERVQMIEDERFESRKRINEINLKCDDMQRQNSERFRDVRTHLYMEHYRVINEYREQTGITPPYVEYSKEGGES